MENYFVRKLLVMYVFSCCNFRSSRFYDEELEQVTFIVLCWVTLLRRSLSNKQFLGGNKTIRCVALTIVKLIIKCGLMSCRAIKIRQTSNGLFVLAIPYRLVISRFTGGGAVLSGGGGLHGSSRVPVHSCRHFETCAPCRTVVLREWSLGLRRSTGGVIFHVTSFKSEL